MKKALVASASLLAFSAYFAAPAIAADLSNGSAQECSGHTVWHFVNNQTGGADPGALDAEFSVGGGTVYFTGVAPSAVNRRTQHFIVETDGDAVLVDASTNLPGRLVLSDYSCDGDGKKDPKK